MHRKMDCKRQEVQRINTSTTTYIYCLCTRILIYIRYIEDLNRGQKMDLSLEIISKDRDTLQEKESWKSWLIIGKDCYVLDQVGHS